MPLVMGHESAELADYFFAETAYAIPPNLEFFGIMPPSAAPRTATTSATTPSSNYALGSPSSSSVGSRKRKTGSPTSPVDAEDEQQVALKRHRNTMAARKYRQKRLDRISDLEEDLGDMTKQRDELKLQLARREAEVEALRDMLSRK